MGRQKGQSQRTKGNVKPSSSRRAASMLAENQTFVGFNAMSGELGYVPMLKSLENDIEGVIDPDFRVALSKINKKDAITKVKALTELTELLETKEVNETLVILPYWPRLYNKLCNDSDRKVRESCQIAFTSMIRSVGKNIAPHLKGIMGWWWVAQSDSHAPAMSAAIGAFTAAFPTPEKQKKALLFCHEEILHCICAIIFSSLKLQVSTEEKDNSRTVSASLNALSAFLKALDFDNISDIPIHVLQDIYLNSKLWKFSKHQNSSIRAAFYSVVSSYCCYVPDVVKLHLAVTAKTILHKLNESNPSVSKNIWMAENSFTLAFNDWYDHVDIRKGFLPQLWALIKSGFHGNAKFISEHLALLISRFPSSLAVYPVFEELLNCLFINFSSESISRSSIETKAILSCTFECIHEILKSLLDHSAESNLELLCLVWDQHTLPLLKQSLTQKHFSVLFRKLFAQFLKKWFLNEKISTNKENFHKVCSVFWKDLTKLGEELTLQVLTNSNDDEAKFLFYFQLLNEIHLVSVTSSIQSKKVHFGVFDTENRKNDGTCYSMPEGRNNLLTNYLQQCLIKCVDKCFYSSCSAVCKLHYLSIIFRYFASVTFFKDYIKLDEPNVDPAFVLLKDYIFPIIKTITFEECSKEQIISIANLFYFVLKHCELDIANCVVTTFNELENNGQDICIYLTQLTLENEFFFLKIGDIEWMTKYITKMIDDLSGVDMLLNNEKWNLVSFVLTRMTHLQPGVIVSILNALNNCSIKTTVENLLQINKTMASCFCMHWERLSDESHITDVKSAFYRFLLPLLELICDEPQAELVFCLRETIEILLKASFGSNKSKIENDVFEICCHCATHLSSFVLERKFDLESFDGFRQATVLIAEELAKSNVDQSLISKWLVSVLPSNDHFCALRPSIDSSVWGKCQSIGIEFEHLKSSELVDKNYFLSVKAYLNLASNLFTVFSGTFSNLTLHSRFQILFLESLLAKAIAPGDWNDIIEITEFFSPTDSDLLDIVQHCFEFGNGWILILAQFASWVSNDYWKDDVFMEMIYNDAYELSQFQFQVLAIFSKRSVSITNLTTLLTWLMKKFSRNHFCFVEKNEKAELEPEILSLLVILLERLSQLQDKKAIYINDDTIPVHLQIIEKIIEWKSSYADLFLFDVDISQAKPKQLLLNSAILNFLQCLIDVWPFALTVDNWDFIECSFVSWMESCCVTFKTIDNKLSAIVNKLLFDVCNLMASLENFITSPVAISDPSLPPSLSNEWGEFFKPAAHSSLIQIYKALSTAQSVPEQILQVIDSCLSSITSSTLTSSASSLELHLLPGSNLSDNVQTVLYHFGNLLIPKSPTHISIHQSIGYTLINKVVGVVYTASDSTECTEPPLQLLKILERLMPEVVESIDLLEFKMKPQKKRTRVKPNDDEESSSESSDNDDETELVEEITTDLLSENSYLYSFLLVWKLLVAFIDFLPSKEKAQYVAALGRNPLTDVIDLFSKLKVILPHAPVCFLPDDESQTKVNLFKDRFDLHCSFPGYLKIQHLACSLYKEALIYFPVYARSWFSSLNKGDRAYMDEYTATHVTNVISSRELDLVSMCKTPSGLTVRSRKVSREVVAVYEISDATFEIAIELPPNYPLTPVRVNTVSKVGIAATQWRYWILQMTMVLHRQNGTIVDALLLWKEKVDKKLEGVEECMICFSVVHGTNTHSLPKLQCRTCRKKYHAECLYKWFDTSNQSTCPLCRSPMMFK